MTRCSPSPWMRTSQTPDPTVGMGFQSLGSSPRCTIQLVAHLLANRLGETPRPFQAVTFHSTGLSPSLTGSSIQERIYIVSIEHPVLPVLRWTTRPAAYPISFPKAFMSFVRTARGCSPDPQSLNEPKSLYQSPSGAYGPDLTQS